MADPSQAIANWAEQQVAKSGSGLASSVGSLNGFAEVDQQRYVVAIDGDWGLTLETGLPPLENKGVFDFLAKFETDEATCPTSRPQPWPRSRSCAPASAELSAAAIARSR